MNGDAEQDRIARRRARAAHQRVVAFAYKRLFDSEDGRIVLQDIADAFGVNHPEFLPSATRPGEPIHYDTHYAAIRSGQRSVYLHISKKIEAEIQPDGNLVDPVEVLTGLSP